MSGLLQKGARRFTTQIAAAGVPDAVATTIPLVSVTGLPTDTTVEIVVDRTDSNGVLTPTKEEVVRGTVSGTSLINCVRGVEGTAQAHSAGATVNSFLTASMWNNIIEYTRDLPTRGLINGLIVPTVAGNNLTVAIKTLQNTDPSPTNPVFVWIGGVLRPITSALSITRNAGTNWLNMGSSELATREVDLFLYMIWKSSTSEVVIGFSRLPYGRVGSDLSFTNTDEKGITASAVGVSATDNMVNVGRFAATLSASPSHNWSVPAFTNTNLIQEPIYETRVLTYTPALGIFTLGNGERLGEYSIQRNQLFFKCSIKFGSTSSLSAGQFSFGSVPMQINSTNSADAALSRVSFAGHIHDAGSQLFAVNIMQQVGSTTLVQWHGSTGIVGNTSPIATWATGDGAFVSGSYLI